jgi:hypothetical protein
LPLIGHRIITRTGPPSIGFALFHATDVKAARCRRDAKPNKGKVSALHVERTALRLRPTIHPPLDVKAGVNTPTGGIGDSPAKT